MLPRGTKHDMQAGSASDLGALAFQTFPHSNLHTECNFNFLHLYWQSNHQGYEDLPDQSRTSKHGRTGRFANPIARKQTPRQHRRTQKYRTPLLCFSRKTAPRIKIEEASFKFQIRTSLLSRQRHHCDKLLTNRVTPLIGKRRMI